MLFTIRMDILTLAEFSEILIIFEKGMGTLPSNLMNLVIIDLDVRFGVKVC